jgi:hypothetical protein
MDDNRNDLEREAYELRKIADKTRQEAATSGKICGHCGRPLAPTDSVTMVIEAVGVERIVKLRARWPENAETEVVIPTRAWPVPVCLPCSLVRQSSQQLRHFGPANDRALLASKDITEDENKPANIRRFRCHGCGRPTRVFDDHEYWQQSYRLALQKTWDFPPFRLPAACCFDCADVARKKRDRERKQHVIRTERTCENCGEMFIPKRADARFCKNACRQANYRRTEIHTPRVVVPKAEPEILEWKSSQIVHRGITSQFECSNHRRAFIDSIENVTEYIDVEGTLILAKQLAEIDRTQGLTARRIREHVRKYVEAIIKREEDRMQRQLDSL